MKVFAMIACSIMQTSVVPVLATTVFWHHFDELAVGATASHQQPAYNSVDAETFQGRLTTMDNTTETDIAARRIKGVSGLPTGWQIYDPVSGARRLAGTAYAFQYKNQTTTGNASCFIIDDGDGAMKKASYTIECFFKAQKWHDGQDDEAWSTYEQFLFAKTAETGWKKPETFRVSLTTSGQIKVLLHYLNGSTPTSVDFASTADWFLDCQWHHAALTYDGTTREVRVYADYQLIASKTLAGDPYWGNAPLSVGYNSNREWGGLCGHIDELRYSDAALGPAQMLRAEKIGALVPVDDDTLYYAGFAADDGETVCGLGQTVNGVRLNETPWTSASLGKVKLLKDGVPVSTDAEAFSSFMAGKLGTTVYQNAGSAMLSSPAVCYGWTVSHTPLLEGDFSYETLIRFPNKNTSQAYLYAEAGNVLTCNADGRLNFNWKPACSTPIDDGFWHHVAVVYEKSVPRVCVYVDYVNVKSFGSGDGEDSTSITLPLSGVAGTLAIGGYFNGYGENIANAEVDEMRLTRRALAVSEFIHPNDGRTYCNIDFEPADVGGMLSSWSESVPSFANVSREFSSLVANAEVYWGLEGESVTNARSLHFISAQSAGGFQIFDEDVLIPAESFTAEMSFCFKEGARTGFKQDCTYLFYQSGCWSVCYNQDARIRFLDGKGVDVATVFCEGTHTQQNVYDYPYDDGAWHTIAYVNDAENNETRCYLDGILVGFRDSALSTTVTDASKVVWVNSGKWGNKDHSAGDFLMDNVRITKGVLRPTEFLTTRRFEGTTLHLSSFENDFRVMPDFFGAKAFSTGGSVFARSFREVVDATEHPVRSSLHAVKGVGEIIFEDNMLLARPHQTVEFFLKAQSLADGTDILSLRTTDAAHPLWDIRYVDGALKLSVFVDGAMTDVASAGISSFDGQWLHCAATFVPSQDGTTTEASIYLNHAVQGSGSFGGQLDVDGVPRCSLVVGALNSQAVVDEIRVSQGTVAVADMLYARKPQGVVLIVR